MANVELARRLRVARESLGLKVNEAAKRLGFANYQTLSDIEAGQREVKASELVKFSKLYFCSLTELLGQTKNESSFSFLWRNPPQSPNVKSQIEKRIFRRCDQYNTLEKLLNLKVRKGFLNIGIDDLKSNDSINNLAAEYRHLLDLGNRPAFTLQKALEQDYGVKVLFYSLPEGSSLSAIHPDFGRVIVINSDEAPWRINYDLAHELFHLVTWAAISFDDLKDQTFFGDIEKRADKFASMLLLPEDEVRKEINDRLEAQTKITNSDLVDIAVDFGVSTKALLYRLAYLRFVDWEKADKIANDEELLKLSRQGRVHERKDIPVAQRFYSLAIRCLRKGLISRGKFAEIVGIDRSDIDDFIEKSGLMESEGGPVEIMAA